MEWYKLFVNLIGLVCRGLSTVPTGLKFFNTSSPGFHNPGSPIAIGAVVRKRTISDALRISPKFEKIR